MALAQFIPLGGGGGYDAMAGGLAALQAQAMQRDRGLGSYLRGDIFPQQDFSGMFQAMVPLLLAREERPFRQQEHADLLSLQREMMTKQFSLAGDERTHQLSMLDKQLAATLEAAKLQTEPQIQALRQAGQSQALTGLMALREGEAARQGATLNRAMLTSQIGARGREAKTAEAGDILQDAIDRAQTDVASVIETVESINPSGGGYNLFGSIDPAPVRDQLANAAKMVEELTARLESASSPQERFALASALRGLNVTRMPMLRTLQEETTGLGRAYGPLGSGEVSGAMDMLTRAIERAKANLPGDMASLRREAMSEVRDIKGIQGEVEEMRRLLNQAGAASSGLSNDQLIQALEQDLLRQLQAQGVR